MRTDTLVVGASGYIGRHVCHRLHEIGQFYTVATRSSLTDRELSGYPGSDTIIGDLSTLSDSPLLSSFSNIIFLVSATVPSTYPNSLNDEIRANLLPYVNVLAKIKAHQRVIFVSSGGTVYGESTSPTGSREEDPLHPRSVYGLVKVMIERSVIYYAGKNQFRYVIIRPSNPIGPPRWNYSDNKIKTHQGVLFNSLNSIRLGKDVKQIGDNSILRDYFDVRDLADLIARVVENDHVYNYTINAGSGIGISVPSLIEIMRDTVRRDFRVTKYPAREFDVKRSVLDITLARDLLDWHPMICIEDSVADTWRWFTN